MHSSRGTSLNKSSTTNYRNSKEHKSIQAASRENFKDEENVANSDEIFFPAHRDDFTAISTSFKRFGKILTVLYKCIHFGSDEYVTAQAPHTILP